MKKTKHFKNKKFVIEFQLKNTHSDVSTQKTLMWNPVKELLFHKGEIFSYFILFPSFGKKMSGQLISIPLNDFARFPREWSTSNL